MTAASTKTPDLISDLRVPRWLRDRMKSVSVEAECLAALGVSPHDGTQIGRRFAYLYREAERCAGAAAPYVYGNADPDPERPSYYTIHERKVGQRTDNTNLAPFLVLGGLVAITCCGALIII